MWGKNFNDYNTVAESNIVKFWMLQAFRLMAFLILTTITVTFLYIYVKRAPSQFQCWSLLLSTITFYILFIGAGKQKSYQTMVRNPFKYNVFFDDHFSKQDQWLWGVFLYNISFSLAITSFILYHYKTGGNHAIEASLKDDQNFMLMLINDKKFSMKTENSPKGAPI